VLFAKKEILHSTMDICVKSVIRRKGRNESSNNGFIIYNSVHSCIFFSIWKIYLEHIM